MHLIYIILYITILLTAHLNEPVGLADSRLSYLHIVTSIYRQLQIGLC